MLQSWLTIAGLVLDFAGFALLLREWWLAFFNEGRQIEAEEQLERMRHLRSLRPASAGTDPFAALHKNRMTRPYAAPEWPTSRRWQLDVRFF